MTTLKNNPNLGAVSRETQKITKNSQSQKTFVPGMTKKYIAQVSEDNEGTVIGKLSHEVSRWESRLLGAICKLYQFLLNPQVRTFFGTNPGTSGNNDLENRDPTGDCCQDGPYPELEFSVRQVTNSTDSDQEETPHSTIIGWRVLSVFGSFALSRVLASNYV